LRRGEGGGGTQRGIVNKEGRNGACSPGSRSLENARTEKIGKKKVKRKKINFCEPPVK